ncbi:hypothetical protein GDO81_000046 [Engystomops pustulosus]|uniref:Ig-like domain-containing protein n=1 Tax=Engystomops pustulosus TaxID=76066 RepID=A0AAV7D510_ENGPU|nr:hypothetical protein GDO81_000046 [Engystomops pustulosus]
MTQTPEYISATRGDTVTISCAASESVYHTVWKYDALAWLQQKPGKPPKTIIYKVSERESGIPERFIGSGSGTDFVLTIKGLTEEDEGDYYCMQYRTITRTQ